MKAEPNAEVDKTVTIDKLLADIYQFIEELEQQVKNNTYPLKQQVTQVGNIASSRDRIVSD
ncbi:hypothetical protein [Microseira wollei]|uniref:Uncharacterized protein n=1 Tax=Microseira wollei NIES-4236 TaxID=2530354 RepID=A0AAV3XFY8_9CYAN|nr:hypothetical protein [Microseira wollei]GET40790.1 hypothetical protein MiSe_56020 [Microseira wollei NIES-4236]